MTKLTILASAAVLAASSLAHAYSDPFARATTASHVSNSLSPVDLQGATGLFARHSDGSIWNHVFLNGSEVTSYQLRWGTSTKGVAAVVDDADTNTGAAAVYLFTTESDGLYYLRVTEQGAAWDSWCHVETRSDIATAPSAVYIENGNIRVYAQSTSQLLMQWRLSPTPYSCQQATASTRSDYVTQTRPIAVAWPDAAGYGRIDVFGTNNGHLVHWWKDEATDDRNDTILAVLHMQDTFYINGQPNRWVLVQTNTQTPAIARTLSTGRALDVAVRDPSGEVIRVGWSSSSGWFTTNPILTSSVSLFDIDVAYDAWNSQPIWMLHGCFNTSPHCEGYYEYSSTALIEPQVYAASAMLATRGFTGAGGLRYFFVVDSLGNLFYTTNY